MNNITKIFVGVDISKNYLDVALNPINQYFRVSNDEIGISKIVKKLCEYEVIRIACEASGGYEKLMLKELRKLGYIVELIDPKLVRYFILSKKVKAKTDKIDASMIALYTASNEPEYCQIMRSEQLEELRDLVRMRYNFVEDAARQKKRLKQVSTIESKKFMENHIDYIEQQVQMVDAQIKILIKNNEQFNKKIKILKSIPGIGDITASALIAEMSELGTIKNKQAAALLGVAPYDKQSGSSASPSKISGGRFIIRKIVYMGALSASHSKGKFGEFYKRLKDKGKKAKVCIVAVMNKIITTANALIKKGETWNPQII